MLPDISVIIVNYKTPRLLVEAIASVRAHNHAARLEYIVVDNASGDDSEAVVLSAFPDVIWLQTGYNAGFGRANNVGMSHARGRYFLLLNADTLQLSDAVDECLRRLDSDPSVAACTIAQHDGQGRPAPAYGSFAVLRRTLYILPTRPFFEKLLTRLFPDTQYADPRRCDWLAGAFVLVRREVVAGAGGFDEDFFMYAEDVEWSHRLSNLGHLLYFDDLAFIHLENQTDYRRGRGSYINRFNVQNQLSNLLWVRRHYGLGAYLGIMTNYLALIPPFFGWKMTLNLLKGRPLGSGLENQRLFASKTGVLLRYFWRLALNQKHFYKIAPHENIR